MSKPLIIRSLGLQPYQPVWQAMRDFTDTRQLDTPSELWLLQHPAVFTQGQAGKAEHLLSPGEIPVIQSDRGGQVTYHAPGQLIAYLLLDLKQTHKGIRELVSSMENAVIELLAGYGVNARSKREAPGVYVGDSKVAALGLRVRRGCTFHGLALNVDMDMEPFSRINPCGYANMPVTQLRELGIAEPIDDVAQKLIVILAEALGYTPVWSEEEPTRF